MKELLCLLGCIALIELFVIVYLLCVLSDIKGQREIHNKSYKAMETKFKDQLIEMESRAQNAESDLWAAKLEMERTTHNIARIKEDYVDMIRSAIESLTETENLRSELAELKERYSRKNQKRIKGKFA